MKKYIFIALVAFFLLESCDLIDGTGIENPNLPIDQAVNLPNPAAPWVNGLNEQIATTLNNYLVTAELSSDNYENVNTFFNQNVDGGTYRDVDNSFDGAEQNIATLREQAEFGLTDILPNDENAQGTALEAEIHFYKGIANLLAGELITAFPADAAGEPVGPAQHFQTAVSDFSNALAITSSGPDAVGYYLALARTYYNLGDQSNAVTAANNAINADATNSYVRFVEYDGVNGPTNTMQNAVYDRANFDDLQPLPRLDFLDPKYAQDGSNDSPIPLLKIEEAYLILAEAGLADNDLPEAQQQMQNALDVVNSRTPRVFDEGAEGRMDPRDESQRPNSSSFQVLFSPDDTNPKSGYILDRTATTSVPDVSGTSRTAGDISALSGNEEALETLYLMRQEIFFGEGRRMVDLGIRWPVVEVEALNNPNISADDRQPVLPGYLPPGEDMDGFTIDGNIVTMTVNLNRILAQQKGNRFN